MPKDLLDLDATPERIRTLVATGALPPAALGRAMALAIASPPAEAWRRFLSTTLLALGAMLVLSGIIYFFAYNWAELHRFAKLGLIAAGIAGSALAARKLGDKPSGHFSLLGASVLVGAFLAVYGQTYQTGADAFELFVGWAALILPWVGMSRFPALWLLLVVLINTGASLFHQQVLAGGGFSVFSPFRSADWLAVGLGLINGFAWATHEHFAHLRIPWLQGRWLPRVLAVMTVAPVLVLSSVLILEPSEVSSSAAFIAVGMVVATLAADYALHRHLRGELFLLTLGLFCVITLVTTFLGRVLLEDLDITEASLLIIPLALIGQIGLAVAWLRAQARATGASEES
ncbi:hypothetical protein MYSTI_06261 [Myxococcus stipitatus DSM 14675]|uniref:DUF2157 domain-containing protein n=1 Tax=Myxococcus stipitatus (strain DSM 14675 / JCM 12634 / Mx s8) TaxID=1278073 RepID=L7UM27_MYXSD|nr:DUF2157 domain-containing protein [Myxococcus stipitatus]AGC47534.1 hypothetical protein MYSTI_06261 [Myxococcus stipitatus DSM 14675]